MSYGSHHPKRFDGHVTKSPLSMAFTTQNFVFPFSNLKKDGQITLLANFVPFSNLKKHGQITLLANFVRCFFLFIYFNNLNNGNFSPNFLCTVLKKERNGFKVCQQQDLHK